jgi:DNA transformation protein and related proteins
VAKKAADPEFEAAIETARELFAGLGPISVRKMFGGAGLYCDGVMFGLVAYGVIHLKVDDASRGRFEAAGSSPFVFTARDGRSSTMSYWTLPEAALDDADAALEWGREGLSAALRAGKGK